MQRWQSKVNTLRRREKGGFAFVLGLVLLAAVLTLQQPMEAYAVQDPGLDSGNATVDRTTVPGQTILKYTTTGTSTFKAPAGVTNVQVLVIGGGGAGGSDNAGGGGAGGYIENASFAVTPGAAVNVAVGGGGTSQATKAKGGNGGNSVFGSLTATGGGGGGWHNDPNGNSGGSGGGAGGAGSGVGGTATAGQGNKGGDISGSVGYGRTAGGGGAGAAGTNGTAGAPGPGGAGKSSSITGAAKFYAAGGGGAGRDAVAGAVGGSSIGGKGAGNNIPATAGATNTGSGGGGGSYNGDTGNLTPGGAGGSGIVVVRFATQNINVPTPGGVSGLSMWYKADGAGNTNSEWKDSSGYGYHLTQSDGTKQPSLTQNAINFNPAYTFNGTSSVFRMNGHGIGNSDSMSAFFAAQQNSATGGWRYFNEFGDDTPSIGFSNGKPELYVRTTTPISYTHTVDGTSTPHVFTYVSPNANGQSRIVGIDQNEQTQTVTTGTYTTSSGGQAGNSFGSTNGSSGTSWSGPVAEAMYFNRVLTQQERQKISSYLAIKYGTTLTNTAYLDSAGTSIYPVDSTFKNNIAGIGRDDASSLSQKQSKSSAAGDIVTVGHLAIASSNQANGNSFGVDKAFLVWGHNGAATNQGVAVDANYTRMSRVWKAVRTTSMGDIKVRVPKSAVTQGNNGVMFISTSTTFDGTALKVPMSDLGTEYEANVTSLPADISYFSFGSQTGSDLELVSKKAYVPGTNTELSTYVPGQPVEYKIKVKNNGPDAAGLVTVTDTLPDGIVPTTGGTNGSGWNCTVSAPTVTCTRPSMPTGATEYEIVTEATIASSVTGSKQNTATVAAANDPNAGNNSKSVTLTAAPIADLGIAKVNNPPVQAGATLKYSLQVKNNGPSDVPSFTVSDPLPAKTTFNHADGISCTGTTTLTCTHSGPLANNATASFDIYVDVAANYNSDAPPAGDGPLVNTATVSVPGSVTDPVSTNNSSTDSSDVQVKTDLTITKVVNGVDPNAHFVAGQNGVYKIKVHNAGPSSTISGGVYVTDTLSEEYTYVSGAGTDWSCTEDDGTVTCQYNDVIAAGGTSEDLLLTVAVDPNTKGPVSNTAEVSSTTFDDIQNGTATHSTIVDSNADITFTKSHGSNPFVAGQVEEYTFSVSNAGPSNAGSYTITDNLPDGLTFAGTVAGAAADCSSTTIGATTVTCTGGEMVANDPAGAQITKIKVNVPASATGTINNSATIALAAGVTNTGNASANDAAPIEPNADLSITKTPNTNVTAGSNTTYTLTTHNAGPSNVASYTVTDKLDPNLTLVPGGGCVLTTPDPTGDLVTCTGGAITNGGDGNITMTVTVNKSATPGSIISNTATVAPPDGVNDPVLTNNTSAPVARSVVASADLQIAKAHTGNFTAGKDDNNFTITVTNAGPSDAGPFTVTDTLPAGMTYVSASSTGINVTCDHSGQTVTCTGNPGIGAGQTSTITLTVAVDKGVAGNTVLSNTASVNSATPDPNNGNNTSTPDNVTIDSKADLEVYKSHLTDFTAGSDEDYSIEVINNGPSDAAGFTVTDTLPAGLTFQATGSDSRCSALGQDVTCTGGPLGSGANTNLNIRVHTSSGLATGTVLTNVADVEPVAPTTDPDNSNNSSSDQTNIVDVTDLSIQKNASGTYTAGETGQFTFTVSNGGPSDTPAGDVQVTDALPQGMTFSSGTGTGWDCTGSAGQSVICTYNPSLATGATTPVLTVTVNIAPDLQGEVANTAHVVSTFDDSDPADDADTITVNVGAEADLTATKTRQGSGDLVAGQNVTYRFEVTNDGGPSEAKNVKITDNLQGRFTYQSFDDVSGSGWNCSETNGTVTCTAPSLAVDADATVDVTLKIAENAPNPLENSASVTFDGNDPSPANPSVSTPLTYSADLEVDISHDKTSYRGGDTINYTLTAKNHGPSAATDAVMTANFPNDVAIKSVSASSPGGDSILGALDSALFPRARAADNPFTCNLNGQKLTCNAGTLFVGTYNVYVTAVINSSFTGQLTTTAHIASATPDPNPSDLSATDVISGVLPSLGLLAGTGQNIVPWMMGALAMLGIGTGLFIRARRKRYIS